MLWRRLDEYDFLAFLCLARYQVLSLFAPLLSPVPGMLSFNLGVYLYLRFCKRLMFYFYFFNIRDIAVSRRRRTDATADDVIGYVRKKMKTTTT